LHSFQDQHQVRIVREYCLFFQPLTRLFFHFNSESPNPCEGSAVSGTQRSRSGEEVYCYQGWQV